MSGTLLNGCISDMKLLFLVIATISPVRGFASCYCTLSIPFFARRLCSHSRERLFHLLTRQITTYTTTYISPGNLHHNGLRLTFDSSSSSAPRISTKIKNALAVLLSLLHIYERNAYEMLWSRFQSHSLVLASSLQSLLATS